MIYGSVNTAQLPDAITDPERALQEQIAKRILALCIIIYKPSPHNHRYSDSHNTCVLSLRRVVHFGEKMPLASWPQPSTAHTQPPRSDSSINWDAGFKLMFQLRLTCALAKINVGTASAFHY